MTFRQLLGHFIGTILLNLSLLSFCSSSPFYPFWSPVYYSPFYSPILMPYTSQNPSPALSHVPVSSPLLGHLHRSDTSRESSARHNLVKSHDHDTSQAIQTILNSLVPKQANETVFSCPDNGTYPHPWDCSKYFLCEEDGEAEEFECLYDLTGLLFDSVSGSCVWAAKAKCFSAEKEENGLEAVEAEFEPDFECEAPGYYPDPDFCMRYFKCNKRLEVTLQYCATGTFYDEEYKKCLWASNVECGDRRQVDLGFEDDILRRYPFF